MKELYLKIHHAIKEVEPYLVIAATLVIIGVLQVHSKKREKIATDVIDLRFEVQAALGEIEKADLRNKTLDLIRRYQNDSILYVIKLTQDNLEEFIAKTAQRNRHYVTDVIKEATGTQISAVDSIIKNELADYDSLQVWRLRQGVIYRYRN